MGEPAASVSRPSAVRTEPNGTTADRRRVFRCERSHALSFTNRLAPRPLGCEPLSVVTVTGADRVSLPPASVTDVCTVCAPLGSFAVSSESVTSPLAGHGTMTEYGGTQLPLPASSGRATTGLPSMTMPTRDTPPPSSRTANRTACRGLPRATQGLLEYSTQPSTPYCSSLGTRASSHRK
jgi:hypothetical protein